MVRNTTGSGIKFELPEAGYNEVNKVELSGMIHGQPKYKEIAPDKNGRPRHMFTIFLKTKYLGFQYISMFTPKAEVTAAKGFCEGDMVTVFGHLSNMKPRNPNETFKLVITATSIVPMTGVQSTAIEDLAKDLRAEMEQSKNTSGGPEVKPNKAADEIDFGATDDSELPF